MFVCVQRMRIAVQSTSILQCKYSPRHVSLVASCKQKKRCKSDMACHRILRNSTQPTSHPPPSSPPHTKIHTTTQVIKPIGQGAYGIVCSAMDRRTQKLVAIKKIPDAFAHATGIRQSLYRPGPEIAWTLVSLPAPRWSRIPNHQEMGYEGPAGRAGNLMGVRLRA